MRHLDLRHHYRRPCCRGLRLTSNLDRLPDPNHLHFFTLQIAYRYASRVCRGPRWRVGRGLARLDLDRDQQVLQRVRGPPIPGASTIEGRLLAYLATIDRQPLLHYCHLVIVAGEELQIAC